MKQSLDDILLFLAITEHGGLAGAARATGTSAPTLGRRMTELETRLNCRLFHRGPRGYALTARGRQLQDDMAGLATFPHRLRAFTETEAQPRVRLTAGLWTARFLARHFARICPPGGAFGLDFVAADQRLDIARREADIGIRNRRPDQPWLSARRTGNVYMAVFASDPSVPGYIALHGAQAITPSTRWVRRHKADEIAVTVSDMTLALSLAQQGAGRVVLPTFAAAGTDLLQVGPVISDLTTEEWLVSHHEARNDPPIRAALDAIAAVLTDRRLRPPPE